MSTEALAAIQAQTQVADGFLAASKGAVNPLAFDNMVTQGLQAVNGKLLATEVDLQRLAVGDIRNLHQVMIHLAEAKESLQLIMQVQGRLMDAYQEVMRMQV